MFEPLLENDYHKELIVKAQEFIIAERETYKAIIIEILTFANKNNLLISNIDLLLNTQEYWTYVDLFCINVESTAKALISLLCNKFDKIFLLKVFEKDLEYYIEYDLRKMCSLNAIKLYKQFTINDVINPVKFKVNENIEIQLFPVLIEIIHLYNQLYDPGNADNWLETYGKIQQLTPLAHKELEHFSIGKKENIKEDLCFKEKNKENIRQLVLDFCKQEKYLIIDCKETVEAIVSNPQKVYESISNFLSKFVNYGISYKKRTLYIPKEFRLESYIYYFEIPCVSKVNKKQFLVLYNNTSYELINYYEKNGYLYVDPIVQIMFDYIAIWNYILLKKIKILNDTKYNTIVNGRYNNILAAEKKIDLFEIKKNYVGNYIPMSVNKKLVSKVGTNKSSYYCFEFD